MVKFRNPTGKSTEVCISEFRETHGDRYDYSNVVYLGSKSKVSIVCHSHGEFKQQADRHRRGSGCPLCFRASRIGVPKTGKITTDIFVERAIDRHGLKYDYSISHIKPNEKIAIICPEHGAFHIRPANHLNGEGCSSCGRVKTISSRTLLPEQFVEKATAVHGTFYDYSQTKYEHNKKKVIIICPEHGSFLQTPHNHVSQRQGCPKCKPNSSRLETDFLNAHEVRERNVRVLVGGRWFNVDGLCQKTRTIYEFYGDFWHGNPDHPRIHRMEDIHPVNKRTYRELYERTLTRHQYLLNSGYRIIFTWEKDWNDGVPSQTHEQFSVITSLRVEKHV